MESNVWFSWGGTRVCILQLSRSSDSFHDSKILAIIFRHQLHVPLRNTMPFNMTEPFEKNSDPAREPSGHVVRVVLVAKKIAERIASKKSGEHLCRAR